MGLSILFLIGLTPFSQAQMLPDQPFEMLPHSYYLNVVDPTPKNNRIGASFPGCRAGNQMILYDNHYDKAATGTNEFGFEVTVVNGVVTAQEGSNSAIPKNGYVLSGHGHARNWLAKHAPIGAHISVDITQHRIVSRIDAETYLLQVKNRLDFSKSFISPLDHILFSNQEIRIEGLLKQGKSQEAIDLAKTLLSSMDKTIWQTKPIFPASAIHGTWHRPVETSAEEVGKTLDKLKLAGFNTVFLETFYHGYTIYPSVFLKAQDITSQNPRFRGWDPLKVWITEAHKRNISLHVWFQSFYVGTRYDNPPGPILSKHPDWANIQYSALNAHTIQPSTVEPGAYFLDPANPDAQTFITNLALEIVKNYDIDGFQMDYMDYPLSLPPDRRSYLRTTWGYSHTARSRFMALGGQDPIKMSPEDKAQWALWEQFKINQVNHFVETLSTAIRMEKPEIKVSATAFPQPEIAYLRKEEDWKTWANKNWIDFLVPMLLTSSVKAISHDSHYVISQVGGKIPIVVGIFGPFNGSSSEGTFEQIYAGYRSGAAGYSLFDTAHLDRELLNNLQLQKECVMQANAKGQEPGSTTLGSLNHS